MRRMRDARWRKPLAWLGVLPGVALVCATVGCAPAPALDDGKTIVAVTILPQAGFVEAIGGDRVEVVVMIPPGASPHTYEPTPDQMVLLSRAALYAKVGSPVEFELAWMDKLIAPNREMLVVDCSRGIKLIDMDDHHHDDDHEHDEHHHDEEQDDHHHEGPDPHIWLSVRNAMVMVTHICDGLVQVDPANEAFYRENCAAYLEELAALDAELRETLQDLDNRRFIVFHPAFGYFARDYHLIQIAVEKGGAEPDAAYMIRVIEEAREHGIRVVFVAPQFSTRSAEVIAGEIGGEVVHINPLARDYIPNLRAVAEAIRKVT